MFVCEREALNVPITDEYTALSHAPNKSQSQSQSQSQRRECPKVFVGHAPRQISDTLSFGFGFGFGFDFDLDNLTLKWPAWRLAAQNFEHMQKTKSDSQDEDHEYQFCPRILKIGAILEG